MKHPGPTPRGWARGVILVLGVTVPAGTLVGCGSGAGVSDRAMIDPAKADVERKAAEEAQRQSYTPEKLKAKGGRR